VGKAAVVGLHGDTGCLQVKGSSDCCDVFRSMALCDVLVGVAAWTSPSPAPIGPLVTALAVVSLSAAAAAAAIDRRYGVVVERERLDWRFKRRR